MTATPKENNRISVKNTSTSKKLSNPSEPSKTKLILEETFVKMLSEKPLKEIGVKELTAAAGLNRNTFYYYYKNIPDLIESIVHAFVDETLKKHPPSYNSYEDCLIAAMEFAADNKESIYHIYNSTSRAIFERYLWKICDYTVHSYVNSFPPRSAALNEPVSNNQDLSITSPSHPNSDDPTPSIPDSNTLVLTSPTSSSPNPHPAFSPASNLVSSPVSSPVSSLALSPEQSELLVSILKYECFGFVMDWIIKGMPMDVTEKIRLLSTFISASFRDI